MNQESYSHVVDDATRECFAGYHMGFLETIILKRTFYNDPLSIISVRRYFNIPCMYLFTL